MNLNSSVGEERYDISTDYATFVGANSFAHNSLSVRMNSHLPPHQLRNLGSIFISGKTGLMFGCVKRVGQLFSLRASRIDTRGDPSPVISNNSVAPTSLPNVA